VTAADIIRKVETAGGVLMLNGDRIRYELPEDAASLVDILRQHRDEVLRVLRGRHEEVKRQLSRWLTARCTSSERAWGAEKFLYRDYLRWCQRNGHAPGSRELFGAILDQCFPREAAGWQGFCLAEDFAVSEGVRVIQ
jgi:hypothetical protein